MKKTVRFIIVEPNSGLLWNGRFGDASASFGPENGLSWAKEKRALRRAWNYNLARINNTLLPAIVLDMQEFIDSNWVRRKRKPLPITNAQRKEAAITKHFVNDTGIVEFFHEVLSHRRDFEEWSIILRLSSMMWAPSPSRPGAFRAKDLRNELKALCNLTDKDIMVNQLGFVALRNTPDAVILRLQLGESILKIYNLGEL
jgi:hypothetical protein